MAQQQRHVQIRSRAAAQKLAAGRAEEKALKDAVVRRKEAAMTLAERARGSNTGLQPRSGRTFSSSVPLPNGVRSRRVSCSTGDNAGGNPPGGDAGRRPGGKGDGITGGLGGG
ncbi:unnamed protein product, partial [Laminaria digitata]